MQATYAVYPRNNLTMFSTWIVQASRGASQQALNAVSSQLNHFRTSLSVIIKLFLFAKVLPPYFCLFITVFSFYFNSILLFFFFLYFTYTTRIPLCWQLLTATYGDDELSPGRGLLAVAWCRRQIRWRSGSWNSCLVASWTSFLVSLVADCDQSSAIRPALFSRLSGDQSPCRGLRPAAVNVNDGENSVAYPRASPIITMTLSEEHNFCRHLTLRSI